MISIIQYCNYTREWTSQQYAEKQRLADEQRKADHLYDLKAVEMDQRAMEVCQYHIR